MHLLYWDRAWKGTGMDYTRHMATVCVGAVRYEEGAGTIVQEKTSAWLDMLVCGVMGCRTALSHLLGVCLSH